MKSTKHAGKVNKKNFEDEEERKHFDIYGKSVVKKTRELVEFNEDARQYVDSFEVFSEL